MDQLLALLTSERDRHAVRDALPGEVIVHFAERAAELRAQLLDEIPAAVLVELSGDDSALLEPILEMLQRQAPSVPVWSYIAPETGAVREVVRLAARGLVADVITTEENLEARLLELLRHSRSWSEAAALRSAWKEAVTPRTRDIVHACIAASDRAATVEDVARQLNRSSRALERQLSRAGLPSVHRVLSWCRLLRAMYRLDHPDANVKAVAAELGYASPRTLALHLRRQVGLTLTDLRMGSRFAGLAACLHAELLTTRARARQHRRETASRRT